MDNQLITYLENVIDLESTVFTQSNMIDSLQRKINSLGCSRNIYVRNVPTRNFGELVMPVATVVGAIGSGIGFLSGLGSGNIFSMFFNSIGNAIEYGLIGAGIGFAAGMVRYFYAKYMESSERKNAQAQANNEAKQDHRRVLAEKDQAARLAVLQNDLIAKHSQTKAVLQKYYDANVLYEKYRHFAAVCMICEYLKSGKCETLRGHEGAYVLYDRESRLDTINYKIDSVLSNLEAIRENQAILYDAIQRGNRTMEKVLNESYKQTRLMEFTSEQSAIAAYNSGVAAQEAKLANWLSLTY